MNRIEGTRGSARASATWGSKKIGLLVAALATVVALALPGVASASSYWSPYLPGTSVTVSTTTSTTSTSDVSWSDVSWSDSTAVV
jgi:hypothetical protein